MSSRTEIETANRKGKHSQRLLLCGRQVFSEIRPARVGSHIGVTQGLYRRFAFPVSSTADQTIANTAGDSGSAIGRLPDPQSPRPNCAEDSFAERATSLRSRLDPELCPEHEI